MNQRIYCLLAWCWLVTAIPTALAYTDKDVKTLSSAFTSAFYHQSGTNGYFKDTQTGGVTYFWGQAEMMECAIDAYEWNPTPAGQAMITNLLNGFISNNGSSWTWNQYNDDIMWATIAFARGGQDTGKLNYCAIAKANFDACYARAWSTQLGGGLYWKYPDNASKNACVNGPASIAAYLLYQIYGDTSYLTKATNIYTWERATLFNASNGAIADNIGTNGVVNGGATTYNQGTFLGAADFLGQTNDAALAANFTMMFMTSRGILPEYGIAGNNSGFNAIFWRWLTRFMKTRSLQSVYEPWLQTNAVAAWNVRRPWDNLSWCQWLHTSPAGTNFYAWDCISSYEILQAADPTQGSSAYCVPTNYAGSWPLDATSGTSAVDATGSGNNGTVNGATWNSSGRFNGCLVFNGINNSVQITNPVDNDFTLSFWVRTTQTTLTGQWYSGAGLVDGDVSFTQNDFGTALVGGKFAFGVGNPDTTVLSTTAINDGAWHHCVATRQQATGLMSVYVDGALQATGVGNRNTLDASTRLLFGAISSGAGYLNGRLDDIRIFSRALASDEVAALYSSTVAPPSAAPTNVKAVAANVQVQLNWSTAPYATSYNVKRSLVDGGPYTLLTNIAGTAYTDKAVVNNHTYYYVVSAANGVGEGTNSLQASATPSALAVWFKADALGNLSNGASVPAWPDSSGNGNNAVQPLGPNQPTYVAGALNGLPVLRFTAANSTYLWLYRPVQDDFTITLVYRSSQGLSTGTSFWNGAGLVNGEVSGSVSDFGMSLNANGQVLAGTGNPDISVHSGTGLNDGQPHVVTFKRTRSTGVMQLYVDGTAVAGATGGTQSLTAPNQLTLGAQQVLNNFLSGDIAEVQIYSTALSDADRNGYERALRCKYGLTGGVTPPAPTGLALTPGNRQITLTWTAAPGAASYNVWHSADNGATYQLSVSGLTTTSFVDTNAANGQMNYYKVIGVDGCGTGTAVVAGVFLPLPTLTMSVGANALVLSWPGWASDWQLYTATNLTPPVLWWAATNQVSSNNNAFSTTVPIGAGNQFFRLSSP